MKKNFVKIILDIIMTFLLLLMYSKNVISMNFHEVGGLIVCGLFLIHMGLNRKWIVGVSKRLSYKQLPSKTRLGYIVDVLLLITMTFIGVSGIMISKTIFTWISGESIIWKLGHFFASAVAIILVGIHIGLHWSFIRNMFARVLKLPQAVARPIAIICLAAVLTYGGYSTATTEFTRWLTMPFSVMTNQDGGMPQKGERPEGIQKNDSKILKDSVRPEGEGRPPEGNQGNGSLNLGRMLDIITSYGSITAVFAAFTVLIEKMLKRKRRTALIKI